MIRIYLTTWTEVEANGKPTITDPISQHIGPDRVLPGFVRFHRIKAPRDVATKRPNKAPAIVFLMYQDGTDTSSIDSELAGLTGVFPLDGETLTTRIDSINRGRQKKIQDAMDAASIPVTLTDHETIGSALKAVSLWLNPNLPQKIRDGLNGG